MMSLYKTAKAIVSGIFYPLYRIQVIGKENVPKQGPVIICSNHISNLDPPVVGITSPRDIYFMAKGELFERAFLRKLLYGIHAFPVKRGMKDRNALRKGLGILEEGKNAWPFSGRDPEQNRESWKAYGGSWLLRTSIKCRHCPMRHHRTL